MLSLAARNAMADSAATSTTVIARTSMADFLNLFIDATPRETEEATRARVGADDPADRAGSGRFYHARPKTASAAA